MATLPSVTSAQFGNDKFKEVYSVSHDRSGMTAARSKSDPYQASGGTITLEVFDAASPSMWGKRDGLSLSGNGINLTYTAICTSVSLSAQVNDVSRYSVTFQVLS